MTDPLRALAEGNPDPTAFRRPLHPHEVRAGVDFAAIRRRLERERAAVGAWLLTSYQAMVDLCGEVMADATSQPDALRRLDSLLVGALPADARKELDTLTATIAERLSADAGVGCQEVLAEIGAQGGAAGVPDLADASAVVASQARRLGFSPLLLAIAAVRAAAFRSGGSSSGPVAGFLVASLDAARRASTSTLLDQAGQAVNAAQAAGRLAGVTAAERVMRLYASEIIDDRTCGPCDSVDGREYLTLQEALLDYPDGQFARCDGADRCRGMLVVEVVGGAS